MLQKRLNRSCAVKAPDQGWGWDQVKCQSTEQLYSSRGSWVSGSASDLAFRGSCGVSERGQASDVVQGRLPARPPDMPRGPVLSTPTPDHNGTVQSRKGGPLWLRYQAYDYPLLLCQDHKRVSTTAVLVSTRTGFPPQVSGVI